ncbi:crossover junction endonuclease MUS81, putative [Babesia caballi]|uniref:Crossover junction endonuclease MUS81 n=1 Tax=Babesia caballi TaxID=5871 RepID=A0AAV4LYV4_BABCB|nr:crossover junction endonuclease MUS81, putative [Babesia caballi]
MRYPRPISGSEDALAVAGVGPYTSKEFETAIEKFGTPPVTEAECAAHAEMVFSRIRAFMANTNFDEERAPGYWKPKRYSSAWALLMVLGLFAGEGEKLGVQTIFDKHEELRARMPKCRQIDLCCIRALVERSLVEFAPLGEGEHDDGAEGGQAAFNPKKRRSYAYSLTRAGRRLAEDIISACEVPIASTRQGEVVFLQTQQSQPTPRGPPEAQPGGHEASGSDHEHMDSASEYYSEFVSDSDEDTPATPGDGRSPPWVPADPESILSFKCNDPSQYVGGGRVGRPQPRRDSNPEVVSITDSASSDGSSQSLSSQEADAPSRSQTMSQSGGLPDLVAPAQTSEPRRRPGAPSFGSPQPTNGPESAYEVLDDCGEPLRLWHAGSTGEPACQGAAEGSSHSEGFRTPDSSAGSSPVASAQSKETDTDERDGEGTPTFGGYASLHKKPKRGADFPVDSAEVSSDRYRRLMDAYDDASECLSQPSNPGTPRSSGRPPVGTLQSRIAVGEVRSSGAPDTPARQQRVSDGWEHDFAMPPPAETPEPIQVDSSSTSRSGAPLDTTIHPFRKLSSPRSHAPVSWHEKLTPLRQRLQRRPGCEADHRGYEVVTVVDNRELHDADGRYKRRIMELFQESGKPVEFRQLPLGDVIWVLRRKTEGCWETNEHRGNTQESDGGGDGSQHAGSISLAARSPSRTPKRGRPADALVDSFVLEWVLERKTTADLAASLTDGRYDDQKIRMLRLVGFKHVCYVFEDIDVGSTRSRVGAVHKGVNAAAIHSARVHTQMVTGFNVLRTTGMPHTAASILVLHRHIERCVRERMRESNAVADDFLKVWLERRYMKFGEWDVKNRRQNQITFLELFGKQLRCIPGCGARTTRAILDTWPTPCAFAKALKTSNLAYINETLTQKGGKKGRAPVSHTVSP